jgi:hypothetical protein
MTDRGGSALQLVDVSRTHGDGPTAVQALTGVSLSVLPKARSW